MAYFSSDEDFQRMGSFGCGEQCRCGPCSQSRAGRDSLAEWYKRDEDEPEEPAGPWPPRANNRPAIGEPPPQGPAPVLQPTRLFQDDPTPPLVRRMRGVMSRGLTPPTLHPPFQPPLPPRPPDLFRLSPEFQRELIEKWERERRNRELTSPPPPPWQRPSLGDAIRQYLDNNLDRLMGDLRVPRSMRSHIREVARDAIGRGATEGLNRALTQMGIGGRARDAINSSVRAAIERIRVR
jgi:hypothetical protein